MKKEYSVRVYDTFFNDYIYTNYPVCMKKYTFDEALEAAKEFEPQVSACEEVQIHIDVSTLGSTQLVGYIDIFGEFVECFC